MIKTADIDGNFFKNDQESQDKFLGEYRKIQHNDNTILNKFLMNLKTLII